MGRSTTAEQGLCQPRRQNPNHAPDARRLQSPANGLDTLKYSRDRPPDSHSPSIVVTALGGCGKMGQTVIFAGGQRNKSIAYRGEKDVCPCLSLFSAFFRSL